MITETYDQMRARHQRSADEIMRGPRCFFAFSNEQFDRGLNAYIEAGYLESDLRKGPAGMFAHHDVFVELAKGKGKSNSDELREAMEDHDFFVGAIVSEMCNHEYAINCYQRNWDTLNVFADDELEYDYEGGDWDLDFYFDQLGWGRDKRAWYMEAKEEYYRLCKENDWC